MKAGDGPRLVIWDAQIIDKLVAHLEDEDVGAGETLMFSQFPDPSSVPVLPLGITRQALEPVFDMTKVVARVLTKNACVGTEEWVELLLKYPDRVLVGLSIGSLDDEWAKRRGSIPLHRRLA